MSSNTNNRISTGITGLDEILHGGLITESAYLARGGPGTGKTTLGLHFLTAGITNGESALFITLEESEESIRRNAKSIGFDLEGVSFLDLSPSSEFFSKIQTYDIFSPADVEREPTTQKIVEIVETVKPKRVFLDPTTQFRYLSSDVFQFRRQVLSFLRYLVEQGATVLFTSEGSKETPDDDLQFMSSGVINFDFSLQYRAITVTKFRGSNFRSGRHSMRLAEKGIEVFPRLLPESYKLEFDAETISSGLTELDQMLHGGLERGTISIFSGPSGVGKTTLGLQFMIEAAGRGEQSVVYSFEEEVEIMLRRCDAINIPARLMVERGTLSLVKIEPLKYSPDEFARLVRQNVEEKGTRIVMIDSIAGYRLSLKGEDLISHLHALSKYLQNMGAVVLLIVEVESIIGDFRATESGISYLADNIVFFRYLEMYGEMHKAIGVLKKRLTNFEKTLREFEITRDGINIGKPLTGLRGILLGVPELGE
jgi:circadian clock protein KaiC